MYNVKKEIMNILINNKNFLQKIENIYKLKNEFNILIYDEVYKSITQYIKILKKSYWKEISICFNNNLSITLSVNYNCISYIYGNKKNINYKQLLKNCNIKESDYEINNYKINDFIIKKDISVVYSKQNLNNLFEFFKLMLKTYFL